MLEYRICVTYTTLTLLACSVGSHEVSTIYRKQIMCDLFTSCVTELKTDNWPRQLIFTLYWRGFLKGCKNTLKANASTVQLSLVFEHSMLALVASTRFLAF